MAYKSAAAKVLFSAKQGQREFHEKMPSVSTSEVVMVAGDFRLESMAKVLDFRESKIQVIPDVVSALWLMTQKDDYAVLKIGENHFASEVSTASGTAIRATSVSFENGIVFSADINKATGVAATTPPISAGGSTNPYDSIGLMLCAMAYMYDHYDDFSYLPGKDQVMDITREFYGNPGEPEIYSEYETLTAQMTMALGSGIERGEILINIPRDGNINMATKKMLDAMPGVVIAGTPEIFKKKAGSKVTMLLSEAKKEFAEFSSRFRWSEAERQLIPSMPGDFEVPAEALKIARRYVGTENDVRPMKNFMWRGITSYGKSTGVEAIAAMLQMPLVRMTCSTNMETNDFLSSFVPVTGSDQVVPKVSMDDIWYCPDIAYYKLTGQEKEDITSQEVFDLYTGMLQNCSSSNGFKRIESNYIKGLMNGYLVEVQEASRIKDSGVLVGLNEYDRPNAVLPLVDGTYSRRDPNALVIYTDNVGYNSCRPVDPSVLRRFAFIIDSMELPEETVMNRLRYNTGCDDDDLMEKLYKLWQKVQEYCSTNEITEGSVSVTELEMWLRLVMLDGQGSIRDNMQDAVISKATSDAEEQAAIMAFVEPLL